MEYLTPNSWIKTFNINSLNFFNTSFNELWNLHPETFDTINIFGIKNVPRWQKSYGGYFFKGCTHSEESFPPILNGLEAYAASLMEENCTISGKLTAVVNWYGNGNHYIGWHSDDECQIIKNSPIVSFTFFEVPGIHREFQLQNKNTKEIFKFPLSDASGLIMCGNCQSEFKHRVPKVKNNIKRINITWRLIKT